MNRADVILRHHKQFRAVRSSLRFSRTNLVRLYDESHAAERIGRLIAGPAFLRETSTSCKNSAGPPGGLELSYLCVFI